MEPMETILIYLVIGYLITFGYVIYTKIVPIYRCPPSLKHRSFELRLKRIEKALEDVSLVFMPLLWPLAFLLFIYNSLSYRYEMSFLKRLELKKPHPLEVLRDEIDPKNQEPKKD